MEALLSLKFDSKRFSFVFKNMRLVLVCVWILIMAKSVHNQEDCHSFPGVLFEKNNESRHYICNETSLHGLDCDCSSVRMLKIQYCHVEFIESEFIGYENVQTLDISFSNYTTLSYLHLNFKHLMQLNVSHNKLTEVHDYLFNDTKDLMGVDFSNNQISNLHQLTFSKVSKLFAINISHNQIKYIEKGLFSSLSDLQVLDLSDNAIKMIPNEIFTKNSNLKCINLSNNPIQRIDCEIVQLLNRMTSIKMSFENVIDFDLSCANDMEWTTHEDEIIFMNSKNKNELRYPKMNFKNLKILSIRGNRLQNPLGIAKMLGKSVEELFLSKNMLGEVNETAFHGLNNLNGLHLSETNLSFGHSNPFDNLDQLSVLDISNNNLKTLNISLFAKTLNNLWQLQAAGNHFDNSLEIIHSLGSYLSGLDISQNFIGTLNRSTFEHVKSVFHLNFSDTHLKHFDVNPLKVSELDISRNKLKRLNVTLLSDTLNGLLAFHAAGNEFENTAEIIEHLGSNLKYLDFSGNFVGKLNETSFKHLPQIQSLKLQRTNLSISNVKAFELLEKLDFLDISSNNLMYLSFAASHIFGNLEEINLSENHVAHLNGLTKHSYPKLVKLDVTHNNLNCDYVSTFKKEWKELEIVGDPCEQFENNEIQTDASVEMTSTKSITGSSTVSAQNGSATDQFTIGPETSEPTASSVVSYAVPIGVSAFIIINVLAIIAYLRRKSSAANSGQMDVTFRKNENDDDQKYQ